MTTATRTITLETREGVETFTTDLTLDAALDILRGLRGNFAQSLAASARTRRGLSPKQEAWAFKLAQDAIAPAPAERKVAGDLQPILDLFQRQRERGAKRFSLRLNGATLSPSRDGRNVWVKQGDAFLGGIREGGRPDRSIPSDVVSILQGAASDPLSAAVAFGRETGECSCCGRELTDPRSIALGIGPICKDKWGL
jgi:hypothetical protein